MPKPRWPLSCTSLAILLVVAHLHDAVAHAQPPATSDARPTTSIVANSSVYERVDGATLVWHALGPIGYATSTCRVWRDGTETCLPKPIPRKRVGPIMVSVGAALAAGGAVLLFWDLGRPCPRDECQISPGIAIGAFLISIAGFPLIGVGARRMRQHDEGVDRLLGVRDPMARSMQLRVGMGGLALRGSF